MFLISFVFFIPRSQIKLQSNTVIAYGKVQLTNAVVATSSIEISIGSLRINVNYIGVVNMFAALLPYREIGKKTTIAAVTSPSGWRGLPGGLGYGSSKAAVINMMESMITF